MTMKTDRVHAAGMAAEEANQSVFDAVYAALKAEGVRPEWALGIAKEYQFMLLKGYWYSSGAIPARKLLARCFGEN